MPEPSRAVTCIGYLRVSTERQARDVHTSLADQEAAIDELAERLELSVDRWYRDAGASGATVEGRPAFRELLAWCEANPRPKDSRGHVLVLNDSRFGRFEDPDQAAALRWRLKKSGWLVRFAEGDDVDGTLRTVVRSLGAAQASEYRENLVRNTRRGMKGAAEQGFWTRRAPFGFRRKVVYPPAAERVLERGKRKAPDEKVKLSPHEEEAAIVRWAFETYAAGGTSLAGLGRELKKRAPSRGWSKQSVRAMLVNDAYRGAVVGGRRREGESELYGCENAHPAIITPETWAAVQARIEKNRKRGRGVRSFYLLSGFLRCTHCGEAFRGGGGGKSRSKNPERKYRRHYHDKGGLAGSCPGPLGTVSRHLIDDAVVQIVGETITSPAVRVQIEKAIDEALSSAPAQVQETEASLRASKAKWEKRRERLVAAVADGTLMKEETVDQMEKIRVALSELDAELQALRFRVSRAGQVRSERDRLLELAMDFPAIAERLKGSKLRELVKPWLGKATFDKVERVLTLGIRKIPAVPYLLPSTSPRHGRRKQVGLIVRRTAIPMPEPSPAESEPPAADREAS